MKLSFFLTLSYITILLAIITIEAILPHPPPHQCRPPSHPCSNGHGLLCCSTKLTCVQLGLCCRNSFINRACCSLDASCGKVCCGDFPGPGFYPKFICTNAKHGLCCFPGEVDTSAVWLEVLTVTGSAVAVEFWWVCFRLLYIPPQITHIIPIIHSFLFERSHHPHKQPNKSKYRGCCNPSQGPLKLPLMFVRKIADFRPPK
jgi:hypothetical protein